MEIKKWLIPGIALLLCRPLFADVRGHVTDRSKNPISGAHVTLTNVRSPELRFEFDTNERGDFSIDTIPNGVYWEEATAEGFVPSARTPVDIHYPEGLQAGFILFRLDDPQGPHPANAELWRSESADVRGYVMDHTQHRISGAHVTLTNVVNPERRLELVTNAWGVFASDTIPNGVYWVEVDAKGFVPAPRTPVDIHSPEGWHVGYQLFRLNDPGAPHSPWAELWGELSDPSGPVAKAKVCLMSEEQATRKPTCTETNRLGQYVLFVPLGPYQGSVVLDNRVLWEGSVTLTEPKDYPDLIALK
jgi:hypothetical protein